MNQDGTYGALAIALAVAAGIYTWWAYRNRGTAAALRGVALVLLIVAAFLTRTLVMFGRIVDAVVDWGADLAFNPRMWIGIAVAGVAVLVFLAAGLLARRGGDTPPAGRPSRRERRAASAAGAGSAGAGSAGAGSTEALPASRPAGDRAPAQDDDMADIEAILKGRGIT